MLIGQGHITSYFSGYQRPEVVLSAMWKAHCPIRPMQRRSPRNIHLFGNKGGAYREIEQLEGCWRKPSLGKHGAGSRELHVR